MTAYQPTTDTVTLSSNAVLYLALRRVFHFVFLSCVVSLFIYVSMHGPIRGNAAIVVALGALGAFFVGVFLLILAIQLAYNYFLVSSYRIQMRPDGVALHYGVFNTSNEVLLFAKI
jgi:hypothetical protein